MSSLVMGKVLPLLLVLSSITPTQVSTSFESLVGTTTTWKIDYNNDTIKDGELTMENIVPMASDVNDVNDLSCSITFNNISEGSEITVTDSILEWKGIPLVIAAVEVPEKVYVDIYVGVHREFYPINASFEGNTWTLAYDLQYGMILGMYQERQINDLKYERDYYMRVLETDAFFTSHEGAPVSMWVAIAIFSIAVVYTVFVTVKDKKIRKKKACFGDGCW